MYKNKHKKKSRIQTKRQIQLLYQTLAERIREKFLLKKQNPNQFMLVKIDPIPIPQLIISQAKIDTGVQTESIVQCNTQEYDFTNITLLFKQLDDLKNQSQQLKQSIQIKRIQQLKDQDEQLEILTKELQGIPLQDQKIALEQIKSEHQKLENHHQQLVQIHTQLMEQDQQLQQNILSLTFQPAL